MKKLLLLDADVVIDLHSLGLFEKLSKSYDLFVTQEVFEEAKFYKKRNQKILIKIRDRVTVIDDIKVECLQEVRKEAREEKESADRYVSFAMMFICAALAAIIPLLPRYPLIALLSIPLLLIIAGARKALFFKHILANRNQGFVLFVAKILRDESKDKRLLDISYEEAVRAFSVVQPFFFQVIYLCFSYPAFNSRCYFRSSHLLINFSCFF